MSNNRLILNEFKIGYKILYLGVILSYVLDGFNKIASVYFPSFSRTGIVFRIIFEVFSLFILMIYINKYRALNLILLTYFTVLFFISNLYLIYFLEIKVNLLDQFIYYNKYFFIIVIFLSFYKVLSKKEYLLKLKKAFQNIFYINGILAILGLLFKIELFSIWPLRDSLRFGYDGLIYAANEASIFYLLGLVLSYFDWRYSKGKGYKLLFSILIVLISGMKASILGIVLLLVFYLTSTLNFKRIIYFLGLTLVALLYLYFGMIQNTFGYYLYFFKNKDFLYALTGGRNTFIKSKIIPLLQKWDLVNYLFGGQNISKLKEQPTYMVEMDFFDVFLFFGIINGLIYLLYYYKLIIGKIRTRYYLFVLIIFFLLAFFSGHFFTTSLNSIYILITFKFFQFNRGHNDKAVALQ